MASDTRNLSTDLPADVRAQTPAESEEPTIGKLVIDASRDFSSLIQSEIALAKSELRVSVKAGGVGIAPSRQGR